MEEDRVENVKVKTPFHARYFLNIFVLSYLFVFFPFLFPGIPGNDSL